MVLTRLRAWLLEYEPHGSIADEADLREFHRRASLWEQLRRRGVHPALFAGAFLVAVVAPGATLGFVFGVEHPLLAGPMLLVLACNALINVAVLLFIDRRFPKVIARIRPAFDVDDETYYRFFGRMFELIYHYSLYAPVSRGPHGRRQRPAFWIALAGSYAFWLVAIAALAPASLPAAPAARWLFVAYYLFVIAWATLTLFTAVTFIGVTYLFLAVRVAEFPIRLKIMRRHAQFGLAPYGRFLFRTLFFAMTAVAVAGIAGLLTGNPLLLLFAVLGTPLVVAWFVGSQYGIHRAIVATKRRRLRNLDESYTEQLDRVFIESTPEPDLETIHDSNSFIAVKDEIESLPNWPTSSRTLYQVITTIVFSNIPSALGLLL